MNENEIKPHISKLLTALGGKYASISQEITHNSDSTYATVFKAYHPLVGWSKDCLTIELAVAECIQNKDSAIQRTIAEKQAEIEELKAQLPKIGLDTSSPIGDAGLAYEHHFGQSYTVPCDGE